MIHNKVKGKKHQKTAPTKERERLKAVPERREKIQNVNRKSTVFGTQRKGTERINVIKKPCLKQSKASQRRHHHKTSKKATEVADKNIRKSVKKRSRRKFHSPLAESRLGAASRNTNHTLLC
nr:hypothetical protein Itr_chr15CG03190 [Ipomoea trifida]